MSSIEFSSQELSELTDRGQKNSSRLWVFGDSFSTVRNTTERRQWPLQVSSMLSQHLRRPFQVVNLSVMGSSQHFAWYRLRQVMNIIRPDDRIIITLTHSHRYWFFHDHPSISNSYIIDFDEVVGKEQAHAAESYIKYIQRGEMDYQNLELSLAWLAYWTHSQNLYRPVIVNCFEQQLPPENMYPELIFSQGSMFEDVQRPEFKDPTSKNWSGHDLRYQHLCLRNHDVMAQKLIRTLTQGTKLDLTQGFHQGFLDHEFWKDPEFVANELDPSQIDVYQKWLENPRNPENTWLKKTGLF